jgi:general secretion pathway protein G
MDETSSNGLVVRTRRLHRSRGVTLVEVLIVVAILALIAGGVAIYAIPRYIEAQKKTAETDARNLRGVVDQWRMAHPDRQSECPTGDILVAERMVQEPPLDPWRHAYRIVCSGIGVSIASDGPDGKPGTEDDIWLGQRPTN